MRLVDQGDSLSGQEMMVVLLSRQYCRFSYIAMLIDLKSSLAIIPIPFLTLSSFQVPKLVKKRIIPLLLKCFHYSVQILFRLLPAYFGALVVHLHKDDLFSGLDGASELRLDARADQNELHDGKMSQMCPRHAKNWVKMLGGVVRDEAERQQVKPGLLSDGPLEGEGLLGVRLGVQSLQVAVQHQDQRRGHYQQKREEEVLEEQGDKFGGADALLPNIQVELSAAFLTVDALVLDDLGGLVVFVDTFAGAVAGFAKFGGNAQILEVGEPGLEQVGFHLLEQFGE